MRNHSHVQKVHLHICYLLVDNPPLNEKIQEEFDSYISTCKRLSLYKIEESAEYGEQLLTLVTCEYSRKNGRMVVVAKRLE